MVLCDKWPYEYKKLIIGETESGTSGNSLNHIHNFSINLKLFQNKKATKKKKDITNFKKQQQQKLHKPWDIQIQDSLTSFLNVYSYREHSYLYKGLFWPELFRNIHNPMIHWHISC